MAKFKDREKAIQMRLKGKSYSEIKQHLKVSKSTLSYWLRDYPLSPERIKELRDWNPRRIENFRNTMREKHALQLEETYEKVKKDMHDIDDRELFIAGFFLYWAEGTKTQRCVVSLSNTDPSVLKFFLLWLQHLGVPRQRVKAKLHAYADMDVESQKRYWSRTLGIPLKNFRKTYVKKTTLDRINHKGGFGHGTCNIIFDNRALHDYILMGLRYLREQYE